MSSVSGASATQVPSLPYELFEPFSHPGVLGRYEALGAIWPTFAEEATRLFLEGHRDLFDNRAPSLASWLRSRIGQLSFEEAWHPSTGLLARPVASTKRPIALATAFALHLAGTTEGDEWTAELEPDSLIRFRNLTARPQRIAVHSSDGGSAISIEDGESRAILHLNSQDGSLEAVGPMRQAGILVSSPIRVLLTDGSVAGDAFFIEEADPFSLNELHEFARDVEAALEFIADYAPDYVDWVGDATTVLVPCRAPEETMLSGSSNTLPGIVRITAGRSPTTTAEMLVHEASHQYLHVALRVEAIDDGSDPETYYSPVKKEKRPLDKIVTAYHAFANVELFYASALENGWHPNETEVEATEAVSGELDVLEAPLRENPALTVMGRALVHPLVAARPR